MIMSNIIMTMVTFIAFWISLVSAFSHAAIRIGSSLYHRDVVGLHGWIAVLIHFAVTFALFLICAKYAAASLGTTFSIF